MKILKHFVVGGDSILTMMPKSGMSYLLILTYKGTSKCPIHINVSKLENQPVISLIVMSFTKLIIR